MRLNKDSFYGFTACAILCATSFAIGANFQANPGREYFDACQAMQGESAAKGLGYGETGRDGQRLIRMRHWLMVMEKFQPVNAPTKAESDLLMKAFPK